MRLLEDTPVRRLSDAKLVENRGSGIRTVVVEARRAHQNPDVCQPSERVLSLPSLASL